MSFKFRLPHYFGHSIRREMNELYMATAIADLALGLILVFEPVFLYSKLGFSVEEVLLFFAAVYGYYIVLIPIGGKIVARIGYKHALALSAPFQILYWLCLAASVKIPALAYLAPLLWAAEKSLFWPAFGSIIAERAREGQIGREFSVASSIISLTQAIGPFIGALIAVRFGMPVLLVVASVVYCAMVIPLLRRRDIALPKIYFFRDTWQIYKHSWKKFLGYCGFAEEVIEQSVWPIFIFLIVGSNIESTGELVTFATLMAILVGLYMGRFMDKHPKSNLIKFGSIASAIGWVLRALSFKPATTLAADSVGRIARTSMFIPVSTISYERAEANVVLPYIVFFEQSLAIGKFIAALLALLIFSLTGSFLLLFLFAALASLLYMLI